MTASVWFLTGSQGLYGPETLDQVADQSRAVVDGLERRPGHPGGVAAGADRLRRHLPARAGRQRRPRLHRRDRLDAHVLAGQDVDPRSGRPADAAAAPAHPGQRRAPLGQHRHGLHEPEPGRPRRPRVRLHPDPARGGPQDGGGSRVRSGGDHSGGGLAAGGPRLVGHPQPEAGPVRRQHAQRSGHRGRQGRGRAEVRGVGQHLRRQRPGRRGRPDRGLGGRSAHHRVRRSVRPRSGAACPAANGTSHCATALGSRPGCGPS